MTKKELEQKEKFFKALRDVAKKQRRFAVLIIDSKNPPIEGDSITVNGLTAVFKK